MAIINLYELSDGAFDELMAEITREKADRHTRYLMTDRDVEAVRDDVDSIRKGIASLIQHGYTVWHSAMDDELYVSRDSVMVDFAPRDYLDTMEKRVIIPVGVTVLDMGSDDYQFVPKAK